jgi:hypothetical protein
MTDICSKEEFEAALEEVIHLYDHPPSPGSAGDDRFTALLDKVIRYRDSAPPEVIAPMTLDADLEARRRRLENLHPKQNPDGIGPTLGLDLSHS